MNLIQKWFELLAGISQDELDRQALSARIFRATPFDATLLEKPACWRRRERNPANGR